MSLVTETWQRSARTRIIPMADEHEAYTPESGNAPVSGEVVSQEELFAKLNASAEKTLDAIMKVYEAGAQEGFEGGEEDRLIEILRRAKALRDEVRRVTGRQVTSS